MGFWKVLGREGRTGLTKMLGGLLRPRAHWWGAVATCIFCPLGFARVCNYYIEVRETYAGLS
jgi:hypothetical protein